MLENEIPKEKSPSGCLILFLAPFILIGIWSLSYSLKNIYKSVSTSDWTRVTATINDLKLDHEIDDDGGESDLVKINYEFFIKNKNYHSTKIAFGYGRNNTEDHESLFHKLENCKKVIAYVNPADNYDSILIKGLNNSIIGMLIFSIMWNSLISIFLLPLFTKNIKYDPKKVLPFVVIIWLIGFTLLLTKSVKTNIENRIEVIETTPYIIE